MTPPISDMFSSNKHYSKIKSEFSKYRAPPYKLALFLMNEELLIVAIVFKI